MESSLRKLWFTVHCLRFLVYEDFWQYSFSAAYTLTPFVYK